MKTGTTGIMDVFRPYEVPRRKTFEWNGEIEDREVAKKVFEAAIASGSYLASVVTAPGEAAQVNKWSEVEAVEKEQGEVVVMLTPAIAGG